MTDVLYYMKINESTTQKRVENDCCREVQLRQVEDVRPRAPIIQRYHNGAVRQTRCCRSSYQSKMIQEGALAPDQRHQHQQNTQTTRPQADQTCYREHHTGGYPTQCL
jgi:hypothetical protein